MLQALFLCEGSSDAPLSDHVEALLRWRAVEVRVVQPDFSLLSEKVNKDLGSRLAAGIKLMGSVPDLVICHRDTDNTSVTDRKAEMQSALQGVGIPAALVAIIPVRMTEAWLLLDEGAIRVVAGNPNGRVALNLPKPSNVERLADPKSALRAAILTASGATGRRRASLDKRFGSHRRQLIERLDTSGPVQELESWKHLLAEVDAAVAQLEIGG